FTDGKREADENNPKGYYEHEAVKSIARNKAWVSSAQGHVVKVIAQLLTHLPAKHNYKVIFMLRNITEVVTSQHKMLMRENKAKTTAYPAQLEITFRNQLEKIRKWIEKSYNVSVLYVEHRNLVESPLEEVRKVKEFLDMDLDINKMASVVDKNLYRERKDK
ncbi:MAG: sulfotransferase domain-containing protein, partial [Bacteroidales bacterium]|nr:sulfotransferase domain-containing protein [Bacteroidales bacterium]